MNHFINIARICTIAVLCAASSYVYAAGASVVAKATLYPMGSFDATSTNVIGKGVRRGNKYFAKKIKVPIFSFTTDNGMRDKHMKETLKSEKFPFVIVENIKAENGSGTAQITFVGVKKDIKFKFKDLDGKSAEATFDLNLPDFKIEDINYKGVGVEDKLTVIVTLPYEKKK